MVIITTILICLALLFSGMLSVTNSTPFQSVPVILMGIACVTGLFCKVERKPMNTSILVLSAICLFYFGLRAYFSPVYDLGVGDLFLILPAAAIFYVSSAIFSRRTFWVFIFTIGFLALLNVLMFVEGINQIRDDIIPFAKGDHQSGLYRHRNFCGNLLMMATLMFLAIGVCFKQLNWVRILAIAFGGCCLVGLALNSARGAFLGMIVGVIFLFAVYVFVEKNTLKIKMLYCTVAIICGIILSTVASAVLANRGADVASSIEFAVRRYYFAMAVEQVSDAPLVGSGSMSYSYKSYLNWGDLVDTQNDHVWVHNEFLQALTDYGLIGFLLITALLIYVFFGWINSYYKLNIRSEESSMTRIRIGLIGITMLVGFSINANLSFPAHSQPNLMIAVIGLAFCVVSYRPKYANSPKKLLILSQPLQAAILVMIAVASITLGYKEAKAMVVLSKYEIYQDNSSWVPDDHINDQWQSGFEEVVKVAPTYLRYERLASILLTKYVHKYGDNDNNEDFALVERSLEYSEMSLIRNPYHVTSKSNKAKCLSILKRFSEANKVYEELIKWTKYRWMYFPTHIEWASSLVDWGKSLEASGETGQAREKYRKAYELCLDTSYYSEDFYTALTFITVIRSKFLMKHEMNDELSEFMSHLYETKFPNLEYYIGSEQVLHHGIVQTKYAEYLFQKRKPELSHKWFLRSNQIIQHLRSTSFSHPDMEIAERLTAERIKLFKTANIQPAP